MKWTQIFRGAITGLILIGTLGCADAAEPKASVEAPLHPPLYDRALHDGGWRSYPDMPYAQFVERMTKRNEITVEEFYKLNPGWVPFKKETMPSERTTLSVHLKPSENIEIETNAVGSDKTRTHPPLYNSEIHDEEWLSTPNLRYEDFVNEMTDWVEISPQRFYELNPEWVAFKDKKMPSEIIRLGVQL